MIRLCLACLLLSLTSLYSGQHAYAQTQTVLIEVADSLNHPLTGIGITISQQKIILKTGTTDKSGKLSLSLQKGIYKIQVSAIGYQSAADSLAVIETSISKRYVLKQTTQLKEVEITAMRRFIINKPGRTVINIKNSPLSTFPTAWEMLRFTPQVRISPSDQLYVANQSTAIYVNDRLVKLGTDDLKAYLETLSGETISKIEVVRSPGAGATADAPTQIKIYIKGTGTEGIKGSLRGGYAANTFSHYNYGGSLDLRTGNFALQSSLNQAQSQNRITGTLQTGIGSNFNDLVNQEDRKKNSLNSNNEFSYQATKNSQFYSVINFIRSTQTNSSTSRGRNDLSLVNQGTVNSRSSTPSINIGYRYQIDSAQKILIQGDYYKNDADLDNEFLNYKNGAPAGDGPSYQTIDRKSPVYLFNASYRKEMRTWALDAGLRYSDVRLDNRNIGFKKNESSNIPLSAEELNYDLREHIYTAYANIEYSKDNWSFSSGLRGEATNVNANYLTGGSSMALNRDYRSLFPSALAQYTAKNGQVYSLSYKKNIVRPDYYLLNPFRRYTGNVTSFEGDINMRPQFTHTIEGTVILPSGITVTAGGQLIKDFISTYIIENSDLTGITERYQNFDDTRIYYLAADYSKNWSKKVVTLLNGNIFYAKALLANVQSVHPTAAVNLSMVNQFKFSHNWIHTVNFSLNTGYKDGFFEHRWNSSLDYTVQKTIPKINLTIQAGVTDLLKTDREGTKALYNQFVYSSASYADSRKFRISLYYSFGKAKLKLPKIEAETNSETRARLEKP